MANQPQPATSSILDTTPILSRLRRNHGLEHATLHMLGKKYPHQPLGGYSTPGGFWIVGDIPTTAVQEAAAEALERMKAGEHNLAVHPFCGTNFATAGAMAGLAGAFAMFGAGKRLRDKLERIPFAIVLATLALIIAQPLALTIQSRITTSGQPGDLQIVQVTRMQQGSLIIHRIQTRG
ncbi:MAG: hypothetical protein JW726_02150 [Anaerolineales bacterium]|nr:hypothetical protein [Anaerolineales bacterium]